jgi:hypothetical protein
MTRNTELNTLGIPGAKSRYSSFASAEIGATSAFFLFLLANLATAKNINEMGNILPFIPLFKIKENALFRKKIELRKSPYLVTISDPSRVGSPYFMEPPDDDRFKSASSTWDILVWYFFGEISPNGDLFSKLEKI